jgi:hypothetical protein
VRARVVGVDSFSPTCDPALERAQPADRAATAAPFAELRPHRVVHLALRAGVR